MTPPRCPKRRGGGWAFARAAATSRHAAPVSMTPQGQLPAWGLCTHSGWARGPAGIWAGPPQYPWQLTTGQGLEAGSALEHGNCIWPPMSGATWPTAPRPAHSPRATACFSGCWVPPSLREKWRLLQKGYGDPAFSMRVPFQVEKLGEKLSQPMGLCFGYPQKRGCRAPPGQGVPRGPLLSPPASCRQQAH